MLATCVVGVCGLLLCVQLRLEHPLDAKRNCDKVTCVGAVSLDTRTFQSTLFDSLFSNESRL
jgi:hypothetical protein